ncbi:hypothetical protein HHI36_021126 [Cryptolaemus montrouzieri]|uniref:Uncharacterized protein n=1 Tax=Cryptolaemus montrouzieri TaxID=559131 RepID=A0ABD2MWQ8_9CUCU
MNDNKRSPNKKLFQQELNRMAKYISTKENSNQESKEVVHHMYIIQQIGTNELEDIGSVIERNFDFDMMKASIESKKHAEHLLKCDFKTTKCMDCIKRVIEYDESRKNTRTDLDNFLFKYYP